MYDINIDLNEELYEYVKEKLRGMHEVIVCLLRITTMAVNCSKTRE